MEIWDINGYQIYLVGGIPNPLKNMKVNWDEYSKYMGKSKCSKPPTSCGVCVWLKHGGNVHTKGART